MENGLRHNRDSSRASGQSSSHFNSHNQGRRPRSLPSKSHYILITSLLLIWCLPICSAFAPVYLDEEMLAPRQVVAENEGSVFDQLAKSGQILVDLSPHPKGLDWAFVPEQQVQDDLRRRQELGQNAPPPKTTTVTPAPADTVTVTKSITPPGSQTAAASSRDPSTSTALIAVPTEAASPLPSAFDTGFNSNITATCSNFMANMLQNSTFTSCLPISVLLQNSMSFFQAQKQLVRITQVLDASCSANVTTCDRVMSAFASNITSTSACSSDMAAGNPLVNQARLGLLAYKPLYTATCLKNQNTKSYCFAEAITNASNPADNYLYYLPLNISLPGGSRPTCNSCLQNTMAVYSAATSDRTSALSSDYVNAAMQVNVNCGPTFTNTSLAAAVSSSASTIAVVGQNYGLIALVLAVGSLLL